MATSLDAFQNLKTKVPLSLGRGGEEGVGEREEVGPQGLAPGTTGGDVSSKCAWLRGGRRPAAGTITPGCGPKRHGGNPSKASSYQTLQDVGTQLSACELSQGLCFAVSSHSSVLLNTCRMPPTPRGARLLLGTPDS